MTPSLPWLPLRWSFLLLALFAWAAAPVLSQRPGEPTPPEIFVVPIEGAIGPQTVALAQRALREAEAGGARAVVLDIDTPGGLVVSMREVESLVRAVMEQQVLVIAFVRREAFSAGAYLALLCRETHMAPGSSIGAIVPVIAGPDGITEIPDDDARFKEYAAMRSSVRALLELRGGYGERGLRLAEGMADPTMSLFDSVYEDKDGFQQTATLTKGELDDLRAQGVEARVIEEWSRPVVLTADQAAGVGFAQSRPSSLDALIRDRFDLPMSAVKIVEPSWSENAAGWIDMFKPLLLVAGFILLMLEFKSPGFAVPGVLGLMLIGTALFGSYLTGLAQLSDVLLLLAGFGLIAVELFLMPGLLLPGIAGFLCVVVGLVLSQQSFSWPATDWERGIMFGNLVSVSLLLGVLVVSSILLWKFLPNLPMFSRVISAPPDADPTGGATQLGGDERAARLGALVGRTGVAATDLRPAGIVEVGTERLDVVAEDGWVERGTPVSIREIQGNRIVVARVAPEGDS